MNRYFKITIQNSDISAIEAVSIGKVIVSIDDKGGVFKLGTNDNVPHDFLSGETELTKKDAVILVHSREYENI